MRAARRCKGQGRRAKAFNRLVQRRVSELKAQQNLARFAFVLHFRIERRARRQAMLSLASPKRMRSPTLRPLGGPRERPPTAIIDALDQRRFDRSDRLASDPDALEPRRNDSGVVDDQRIAGVRKSGRSRTCASVQIAVWADNQHPRAVPRIRGSQRDAFEGENKIEGVDAHCGHRHPVEAVNLWRGDRNRGCDPEPAPPGCPAHHEPQASL